MFAATCCEVMKYDWTDLRAALADSPSCWPESQTRLAG